MRTRLLSIPMPMPGPGLAHAWVLFLTLLALAPGLSARGDGITAALERDVVPLGEPALLRIEIQGDANGVPSIPDVPGLQIVRSSTSTQIQIVNGTRTSTLLLGYTLTPTRLGTFSIGPFSARIGGQLHSANAVQLRVVAANDPAAARKDGLDRAAFVEIVLPRTEVFVGESFLAEAHLYALGGQVEQAPQITGEGFTLLGKPQNLRSESNIRTNDRIYGRVRYLQALTPVRTGDLLLEATNCVFNLPVARRQRFTDAFDELFGGREMQRLRLSAPPATLRVLPLPRSGQPPRFNGAVGDFQVSLTASPTNLQAGDPITLRIDISGNGNLESVQLPDQPAWKGFRVYPAEPSFQPEDALALAGTKRFVQVLTPESSDITQLPPFEFAFFDPRQRQYRTVRTEPVPLSVAPGARTPTIPTPAGAASTETAATTQTDIVPLKPHLGLVASTTQSLWLAQPWFLALALLPMATWLGIHEWQRARSRRASNSQARQRELLRRRIADGLRSLESLSRQGDSDAFHSTLFRVLQDTVAARTGQPPSSITEGSLESDLVPRGVPPETIATLHTLFQACNQARYARQATPGDLQRLHAEASKATSELVR